MKKTLTGIALSGLILSAHAQSIPGTHCRLQAPEGFTLSDKFSGYQHKASGASLLLNEIPAPYAQLRESFGEEALATQGIRLRSQETLTLPSGREASLLLGAQTAGRQQVRKIILLTGDDSNTVLLTGNLPEAYKLLEPALIASAKTLTCNFSEKPDFAGQAPFRIETAGTTFQPVHFMSGMLLFTADGQLPSEEALFTVGESFSSVSGVDYGAAFTEKRFQQLAKGRISRPSQTKRVQVGPWKGHEITGHFDDSAEGLLFLTILDAPERKGYYILVGETNKDAATYLPQFRQMTQTLRQK